MKQLIQKSLLSRCCEEGKGSNSCTWLLQEAAANAVTTPLTWSTRVQNAVLKCNLKNDRLISVHVQGKLFSITVIQVYDPVTNAEEAEVERFYEDLQGLLELTPKKVSISSQGTGMQSRKSRDIQSNRQPWPWSTE